MSERTTETLEDVSVSGIETIREQADFLGRSLAQLVRQEDWEPENLVAQAAFVLLDDVPDLLAALAASQAREEALSAAVDAAAQYINHLSDVDLHVVVDARVLDDYRAWQRALTRVWLTSPIAEQEYPA